MQPETFQGSRAKIAYWQINPDKKYTIVLVHGFLGDHTGLNELAPLLQGYRVIMPDLPGHGASGVIRGKHTLHAMAQSLNELFKHLHLQNIILVGHSFGAVVCLRYMADFQADRVGKLIVLAPYPEYRLTPANIMTRIGYALLRPLSDHAARRVMTSSVFNRTSGNMLLVTPDKAVREHLLEKGGIALGKASRRAALELATDIRKFRALPLLQQLNVPTLVVSGNKDSFGNIASVKTQVKNPLVKFEQIDGAGHLFPLEDPQATARRILRWLN